MFLSQNFFVLIHGFFLPILLGLKLVMPPICLLLECMHRKGKCIELPAWLKRQGTELSVGESLLGKEGEWIDGVAGN